MNWKPILRHLISMAINRIKLRQYSKESHGYKSRLRSQRTLQLNLAYNRWISISWTETEKEFVTWRHEPRLNFSHLLSDGRRESNAKAESFLLSGCVILSMRSTHISIIWPRSRSGWKKRTWMNVTFVSNVSWLDNYFYNFAMR